MLRISLYNMSAQKRRLTQIFADYYSNYLFLICANLRKSVFLIISFYFAYLLISPFLRIYTASAVAVYIHQQLQYIFIGGCSIYSTADAVYIHFSGVLSCMFCSACCAFGAMRFWPPLMMQTNWGSSRSWSLSISSWYSLGIIQRRRHFTCERSALRFSFRYS